VGEPRRWRLSDRFTKADIQAMISSYQCGTSARILTLSCTASAARFSRACCATGKPAGAIGKLSGRALTRTSRRCTLPSTPPFRPSGACGMPEPGSSRPAIPSRSCLPQAGPSHHEHRRRSKQDHQRASESTAEALVLYASMMVAEAEHRKGEEGALLAKRFLESTTYINITFSVYDDPAQTTLIRLDGKHKRYDLTGVFLGDNRRPLFVEVKNGSPDVSVGRDHAARPGRGGQSPPRVRSAMAMSDSGLRP